MMMGMMMAMMMEMMMEMMMVMMMVDGSMGMMNNGWTMIDEDDNENEGDGFMDAHS